MDGDMTDLPRAVRDLPTRSRTTPHLGPRSPKKAETVAQQLLDRIGQERLAVGDRLDQEHELLSQLGVSRGSLREGLRLLEVAGILRLRTGRDGGAIVQRPDGGDFARMATMFFQATQCTYRDLLLARIALEPEVYATAARSARPEALDELQELWNTEGDFEAHAASNRLFFSMLPEAVAEAAGNPVLVLVVNAIAGVFMRHMDAFRVGDQHRREAARIALLTIETLRARDAERVARLVRRNLEAWLDVAELQYPHVLDSTVSWDH